MGASRDFRDKTVVITGAAGGIGSAFAHRFGQAGAKLGLLDLSAEGLEALSADLRARDIDNVAVACDLTNPDDCQTAIDSVIKSFGGIDVLINNAGITHRSAFRDTSLEVFRESYGCEFLRLPLLREGDAGKLNRAQRLDHSGQFRCRFFATLRTLRLRGKQARSSRPVRFPENGTGASGCGCHDRVSGIHRHRDIDERSRRLTVGSHTIRNRHSGALHSRRMWQRLFLKLRPAGKKRLRHPVSCGAAYKDCP